MTDPCKQENMIGSLEATMEAIQATLERLERGQERIASIMEAIAAQGAKLTKLEHDQEHLFSRVRNIEIDHAEQKTKIAMASAFVSMVIAAVVGLLFKHLGK